ncbi:MAG: SDR family oxidoreductase [Rhodothermales bacterium]|nr:SDR family oxidoreductase [Rhodothermales bacterium]MBO6781388.1 SDR family oxidoreductase [Rhodothermales bacterium]
MRVTLVTGGSGFVGTWLVRALLDAGDEVRVLARNPARLDRLPVERLQVIEGDVTDPEPVQQAVRGCARVYHCAAFVGFGGAREHAPMMRVNVGGTRTVVDACLEEGVERLVHTSSIAALGRPERSQGCYDETTDWVESSLNTHYALSKHLAELEIHRGVAEGLDAVMVNPSLVMGPGRPGENTMRIAGNLKRGKVPGIPSGATNVVDVRDVAAGHIAAMDRGRTGERYILASENLTWQVILSTLADELGVQPPKRSISLRKALVAGAVSEVWARISGRPALLTREAARVTGHRTCYENAKAVAELGVQFRPFLETARDMAAAVR